MCSSNGIVLNVFHTVPEGPPHRLSYLKSSDKYYFLVKTLKMKQNSHDGPPSMVCCDVAPSSHSLEVVTSDR